MERIEQARDALEAAKTALEYSVNSLDGVVSIDEEDEGEDGGSLACQACIKINRRAIAKIDAALSALEAEGGTAVKVKALPWAKNGREEHSLWAMVDDLNRYWAIEPVSNVFELVTHLMLSDYGDEKMGLFPTLEAAKAAAQADYERRIRSALEGGNQ